MKKTKWILAWFLAVALLAANCLVWGTQTQAAPKVKKLTLNRSSYSMFVGESVTLRVSSVQPSKASKKVTWQSSNRKIATVTVTASGVKVKAKKSGKVTITAKSRSNPKVKAACTITIHKNTNSIKLNGKNAYTLKAGTTKQLSVTTSPKKQPVIWSSKNTKIAKVNSKGKVTAVAKGKTTITAKSGKKTVKVTITVTEDKNIVDSGKIQGLEWKLYRNGKMTISGTYKPEGRDHPLPARSLISESLHETLGPCVEAWEKESKYPKMVRSIVITAKGLPSMDNYFADLENLETVDMRRCDTSKVTSMVGMFSGCKKLKSVNLKGINTKKVKNMSSMFFACKKLETLDLSGLDTRNVTDMSNMFSNCKKLKSINLKGISTRSVTNMSSMFASCESLQSLDLSGFDTHKVTDLYCMFIGCESLQSLDLSGFDTRKAVNMGGMFDTCTKLKKLNISSFDTRNVKNIGSIFCGCRSLKTLDLPLKFTGYGDRKKGIEYTDFLFTYCNSLEELDAGGLVWCGVHHLGMNSGVFSTCKKLKKLDLSHTVVIEGGSLNCANLESVMIPVNLTVDVKLPAVFQDASGNTYDYIPRNMPKTFEIRRVR